MLVRNNTSCPSCGNSFVGMYSVEGRESDDDVTIHCDCYGCGEVSNITLSMNMFYEITRLAVSSLPKTSSLTGPPDEEYIEWNSPFPFYDSLPSVTANKYKEKFLYTLDQTRMIVDRMVRDFYSVTSNSDVFYDCKYLARIAAYCTRREGRLDNDGFRVVTL
jgi:hypothetical protein